VRIHQFVKNIGARLLVRDQPGRAEHRKLLRRLRLTAAAYSTWRTDADTFGVAEQLIEDLQPHRMSQRHQQVRAFAIQVPVQTSVYSDSCIHYIGGAQVGMIPVIHRGLSWPILRTSL
jgi:hypothetical protein